MEYVITFWELSFAQWFDCLHRVIFAETFDKADEIASNLCDFYGYDMYTIDTYDCG